MVKRSVNCNIINQGRTFYEQERYTHFITHNMELQISYRFCPQIQKKSILW